MARPSPKRFPLWPVWPKRSARSPNAGIFGNWAINCWVSMNRSASCGLWRGPCRPPAKKTAETIKKEVTHEVDQAAARHLQRPPQNGAFRSASHRDGGTLGHASGGARACGVPCPVAVCKGEYQGTFPSCPISPWKFGVQAAGSRRTVVESIRRTIVHRSEE